LIIVLQVFKNAFNRGKNVKRYVHIFV